MKNREKKLRIIAGIGLFLLGAFLYFLLFWKPLGGLISNYMFVPLINFLPGEMDLGLYGASFFMFVIGYLVIMTFFFPYILSFSLIVIVFITRKKAKEIRSNTSESKEN